MQFDDEIRKLVGCTHLNMAVQTIGVSVFSLRLGSGFVWYSRTSYVFFRHSWLVSSNFSVTKSAFTIPLQYTCLLENSRKQQRIYVPHIMSLPQWKFAASFCFGQISPSTLVLPLKINRYLNKAIILTCEIEKCIQQRDLLHF